MITYDMQINRSRGHEQQPSKSTLTIHQVQRVRQRPSNHHQHLHHRHHPLHQADLTIHSPTDRRAEAPRNAQEAAPAMNSVATRCNIDHWQGRIWAVPSPPHLDKIKKNSSFFLWKPSLRSSRLSKHYHFAFKGSESIGTASITSKDSGKSNAVSHINCRAPRRPLNPKWGVC